MDRNNKRRIVILGAGESGVGAAILAQKEGFDLFVSDKSPIAPRFLEELESLSIPYEQQKHTAELILSADEVIKSPGIPDKAPIVVAIRERNIPIVSEIEFASRYTNAKMICITGSNGKTTTTMLTYHILKQAGLHVGLAGNVGFSLAREVAGNDYDYFVIELSSFQLDGMYQFKADVAVLLNITPDHLDRYNYEMQNYVDAKFRITRNQTHKDAFIFWNDDPIITRELQKRAIKARLFPFTDHLDTNGVAGVVDGDRLVVTIDEDLFEVEQEEMFLRGKHNLYNSLASIISARLMQVRKEEIRASLATFKGIEHRMECVAHVKGVAYVNDSKATNVNSCWYALQSLKTPTVLILGGTDKGNDYDEIRELVEQKVTAMICLGLDNKKLLDYFSPIVPQVVETRSMQEAVDLAYQLSKEGDTVLLSPCCASFDLFKNYEDRGDQFKSCVRNL